MSEPIQVVMELVVDASRLAPALLCHLDWQPGDHIYFCHPAAFYLVRSLAGQALAAMLRP